MTEVASLPRYSRAGADEHEDDRCSEQEGPLEDTRLDEPSGVEASWGERTRVSSRTARQRAIRKNQTQRELQTPWIGSGTTRANVGVEVARPGNGLASSGGTGPIDLHLRDRRHWEELHHEGDGEAATGEGYAREDYSQVSRGDS